MSWFVTHVIAITYFISVNDLLSLLSINGTNEHDCVQYLSGMLWNHKFYSVAYIVNMYDVINSIVIIASYPYFLLLLVITL